MNNLFQYWVSYYKKDKWYLIVPFLIFLAGIIVLVSQVSIERTRAEQEARARAEQERAQAEQEERARTQQVRLKKEQERVAAEERCRQDLQCLAEKHFAYATVYCANQIKRLARFDFEWTDKWHERKFSHFRWKNRENGVITYMGDKARFQNAFGAMQPHIYECDIDTQNEKVIGVRARPGRL